jgi:hypothetical protein
MRSYFLYLFQLYTEFITINLITSCQRTILSKLSEVENNGFEPLTLCVQGRCSSQLS